MSTLYHGRAGLCNLTRVCSPTPRILILVQHWADLHLCRTVISMRAAERRLTGGRHILCAGNLERIGLPDALAGWKVIELLNDIQRMGPLGSGCWPRPNAIVAFASIRKISTAISALACRDVCQAFHNAQS